MVLTVLVLAHFNGITYKANYFRSLSLY